MAAMATGGREGLVVRRRGRLDGIGTLAGMAPRQRLDANLARVVARGRAHAAESGELTPRRIGAIDSVFTDDAREMVADWQRDGGYERALIEIAAADPDLAAE